VDAAVLGQCGRGEGRHAIIKFAKYLLKRLIEELALFDYTIKRIITTRDGD
jgi:hypothetical protein